MAKGKEIRRSFSAEFKLEAVRRLQACPAGVSVAHIGRELGVRPDMLREWLLCGPAATTTLPSVASARSVLFHFIEVWYNRQRLHSSLGYRSPAAYEQDHDPA